MSGLKKFEISPVAGAIAVRNINTDGPNNYEYHRFSAIKSIVPVYQLNHGERLATNQRKNPVRHDSIIAFEISFINSEASAPIRYNIKDVSNQPTWTNDFSGLAVAISDMNSWAGDTASNISSLASKTVASTVLNESGAGTTPAGVISGSCFNSGDATGTWNGEDIPAGVSIPLPYCGPGATYGAIAYDGSGTLLIIQYSR